MQADSRSILAGALLMLPLVGCGPDVYPPTGEIFSELVESPTLGETLELLIRLPSDYDESSTYPVVIQLDPTFAGLRQFDQTVGLISHHAAAGDWPEAIVVGIDYAVINRRFRDFELSDPLDPEFSPSNEGADRFYVAIRDEILPHVEQSYATDAQRRILVGHSNGGIFSWYSALRHRPEEVPLFVAHIAADAAIHEELFTLERWHFEHTTDFPIRMYASRAEYSGLYLELAFNAMIARLQSRNYTNFTLVSEAHETNHGGAIPPSYENGLDLAFNGAP